MADIDPNVKIPNLPPGDITFLFSKTLSPTDINHHISLPEAARGYMMQHENAVFPNRVIGLYTPNMISPVTVEVFDAICRVETSDWTPFVSANEFKIGDQVLCWGVYERYNEGFPNGVVSLAICKIDVVEGSEDDTADSSAAKD